jgi:hypothetical protein
MSPDLMHHLILSKVCLAATRRNFYFLCSDLYFKMMTNIHHIKLLLRAVVRVLWGVHCAGHLPTVYDNFWTSDVNQTPGCDV